MEFFNSIFFYFLFILFSYLIGSVPFGYLFSKYVSKIDIREIGSGNIGTTNVLRTANKLTALLTLFFDTLKGFAPVWISLQFSSELFIYVAIFALLGHMYPIWLKFNGGKGVATFLGLIFAISIYSGFLFILSWIIIAIIFRKSSVSSLSATLFSSIYIIFYNPNLTFLLIMTLGLIITKHRENIIRIYKNTEPNIKI
ncbi:MAG: acyl-phosphate glycerol 3-phosphate acyltransferase [Rhodobiaceae bacterium]|nr:acyl-phosphate glycerol 3-phosphate acyltransferase [Rhodobiaceae bacterium]